MDIYCVCYHCCPIKIHKKGFVSIKMELDKQVAPKGLGFR